MFKRIIVCTVGILASAVVLFSPKVTSGLLQIVWLLALEIGILTYFAYAEKSGPQPDGLPRLDEYAAITAFALLFILGNTYVTHNEAVVLGVIFNIILILGFFGGLSLGPKST